MSVQLEDHAEWIDQLEPGSRVHLENHWSDATKVFSARGLDNFVKGAAALRSLGRGHAVVDAWIDCAPQVAQEIGEDVVSELASTPLMLASKTSGAVIELVIATAPTPLGGFADQHCFTVLTVFKHACGARASGPATDVGAA